METSLIGKALDFGSNEYGFESHVSNIFYSYSPNYVINHIHLNSKKKNLHFTILYTNKNITLIKIFKKLSLIKSFYLIKTKNNFKIRAFINFVNKTPLSHNLKIISTPSRNFFISYKALLLLHNRTLTSIYLLSTNLGIITHFEALKLGIGGKLFLKFSI